ncbi:amino acid adenylation domain-containing protein [Streptomyces sp. NPDC057718]|uniref:amino acid adenylation domain-containing protein n=1 Tax=Streptomyces sp. NPDC057718 TaxID=3346225 RepID=UPI0036874644
MERLNGAHESVGALTDTGEQETPIPDGSLTEVFEKQVAQTPDAVAVEYGRHGEYQLSYAELDARAERLARRLVAGGARRGGRVGVLVERSAAVVVTLLAVAKTGAAYVPLDVRSPEARLGEILESVDCALLVVDARTARHPVAAKRRTVPVDEDGVPDGLSEAVEAPYDEPGVEAPGADDVLYVMHTSGSTGVPKGVRVTHRNVLALALDRVWRGGAHERVLFHSPHAFDASTYEIWVPLLSGGRVVVAPEEINAPLLRRLVGGGRVTALWLTAGLFGALATGDPGCLEGAREVWAGGDVVPEHAVRRVVEACPGITLYNGYGPTETTTFATRHRIHPGPPVDGDIPIGRPMDHTRVYVLDTGLRPVADGETGQLYVAGAHVAAGYEGDEALTRERFLPDPFGARGERMYATGDLARRDAAGDLRYAGRADRQVKVNGFRIEPGETEAALTRQPRVAQASVVVDKDDDGGGRMTAYVVLAEGTDDSAADGAGVDGVALRRALQDELPSYLVPADVVLLPRLPLTTNGKIDRARLAESSGVPALVERWVRRRPAGLAVHDPVTGARLTYAQLWQRSGRLAAALAGRGVRPGDLVAVDLPRSAELVVAFLGIARAGAAYLPLDLQAPPERVAELLAESGAVAAVAGERTRVPASTPVLRADGGEDAGRPPVLATRSDEDPLYVTYTSGSTGRPKGVAVPHRAVERLVEGAAYCPIEPGDRVASTCNPAFDVTTCEIWSTLCAGGTVVPLPTVTDLALDEWVALVRDQSIAVMFLTTSLFHTAAWELPDAFSSLETLVVGGEQLDLAAARRVLSAGGPRRLVNGYGPTEATAFATWFLCTGASLAGRERVPIGRPLQRTTAYVLDDELREAPVGEPGELCLGGPGVALGYLHRAELTAERFVTAPGTGERLYRTGDLVRLLPDGELEMLGRRDRQVKLRGFRIELEEVERAAVATGLVDAAFIEKTDDSNLAGCVLPAASADVAQLPGVLSARLAERLPEYMIPARWLVLDELPIGSAGKADRARMLELLTRQPEPDGAAPRAEDLRTPTERTLAAMWSELLEVPVTSRDASFWDLGGHSLRGITLIARIRERLDVRLRLRDLFRVPVLADLAARIDAEAEPGERNPAASQALTVQESEATAFQQQIWLAENLDPQPGLYNVPFAWRVDGRLDADRLAPALERVVARHEALRTTFSRRADGLRQLVGGPWRPGIRTLRADDRQQLAALLRAAADDPFDLEAGPLLRAGLIEGPDGQILYLTVHHIVFDAESLPILLESLRDDYAAAGSDAGGSGAGAPGPQFRELAAVTERRDPEALARWTDTLRDAPSRLGLAAPAVPEPHGTVPLALPDGLLQRMRPLQERLGMSWFMVASAALAALLHHATGHPRLTFGFPVDTREGDAFARVVGPCLNTVVVPSRCGADTTVGAFLEAVRDGVLDALDDRHVPFAHVVEALNPPRTAGATPYLDVVLAPQTRAHTPPRIGEARLLPLEGSQGSATYGKFALTVGLAVTGDRLSGEMVYRGDRLSAEAVRELARLYPLLLAAFAEQSGTTVARLAASLGVTQGALRAEAHPGAAVTIPQAPAAPEAGVEQRVAAIWASVLGLDPARTPGADANFFDCGGTSLKLVTLHAELCRAFDTELPVQRLFESTTVGAMARLVARPESRPATAASGSGDLDARAAARRRTRRPGAGGRV